MHSALLSRPCARLAALALATFGVAYAGTAMAAPQGARSYGRVTKIVSAYWP